MVEQLDPGSGEGMWRRSAPWDKRAVDSAGKPWRGRELSPQPFADDDGTTPPALADAMEAVRENPNETTFAAALEALSTARVLIPLIAELGEEGRNANGAIVDKQADLAIVTVAGPDGRAVLPVFTSVAAMQAWNSTARPVPVEAVRVAVAAVDADTQLMIVDPGTPQQLGLRRPAVWALAQGETWRAPWRDEQVLERLAIGIATVEGVVDVSVEPGAPCGELAGPELTVTVTCAEREGVTFDHAATSARLHEEWAQDAVLIARADSLALTLHTAVSSQYPNSPASSPAPGGYPPGEQSVAGRGSWFKRVRDRGRR